MKSAKVIQQIAKVCHEVNRVYCESIGDLSQKKWDKAEKWQKDSAISGVKFALQHPNGKMNEIHKAWMADKKKDGWKYGKVKDAVKKTHPCLVAYDELPKNHRTKDALFLAVVRSFE